MSTSKTFVRFLSSFVLLFLCATVLIIPTAAQIRRQHAVEGYGQLPLVFEENRGQSNEQVRFLSRSGNYTLFLTDIEVVMVLQKGRDTEEPSWSAISGKMPAMSPSKASVIRMKIEGSTKSPAVTALDRIEAHSNYIIGNDPKKWVMDVPLYGRVRFQSLYPGIDLEYYGTQATLEYDFVVAPGADPEQIRLSVEGSDQLSIDNAGDLVVRVGSEEIRWAAARIYQRTEKGRAMVDGKYEFTGPNQVGFSIADYDRTRPLIIDPQLSYSTFLGGSDYDTGINIAVDKNSNAYITGRTSSANFPTTAGAYSLIAKSSFVTKISADGSSLAYSTYFGSAMDTTVNAIAVNNAGEAFLVGTTDASDLPTTANAFQNKCGLDSFSMCTGDAFVAKLSADGSKLLYSSYLGGAAGDEKGYGVALDSNGNAYVYGATWSTDFPTTPGAYETQKRGFSDVFVAKFNTSAASGAQSLVYSTCIGGTGNNADQYDYSPHNIAVDATGNVYLAGGTIATDYPTTEGAFQTVPPGDGDGFVTKLNAQGSGLVYSTYLGGTFSDDRANSIAVDKDGNAYVAGMTHSPTFPVTKGALYDTYPGAGGFITKLNPSGSGLVYSTYFPNVDQQKGISNIALDASGNVFVMGVVSNPWSNNYQLASPIQSKCGLMPPPASFCSNDAFIAKINAQGNALIFSTLLGGSNDETATGLAVDSAGNAYVIGRTYSVDFPTASALQSVCATDNNGGCSDAYIAKLSGLQLPVFAGLPQFVSLNPPVGSTATQSFTISNLGDATLNFSGVSLSGSGYTLTNNSCAPTPGVINAGESCTLMVSFVAPSTNLYSGTLTITDNAYLSPHQITLQGRGSDFVMGSIPGQATITAGQSTTFGVGAQPVNGFNQPITLVCNGLPSETTCQFASSTLLMDGINIVATTVTINTMARSTTSTQAFPGFLRGLTASLAMMMFVGVLLSTRHRRFGGRREFLGSAAYLILIVTLLELGGCGGGSTTPPQVHGTPAGVYSITVNATSAGLQRNTTFQLTVN
jgi:hypothetical protein